MMNSYLYRSFRAARRALVLNLALLLGAATLAAQESASQTYAQPSQALDAALEAFSETSGIDVVSRPQWLERKTAPALEGDHAPREALDRLLADTGLDYRFTGERTVAVITRSRVGEADVLDLEPVELAGRDTLELEEARLRGEEPLATGYSATDAPGVTKTSTPIIDTPFSIQVVPQQVLEDQQALQIKDAVKNVSGVQPRGAAGVSSEQFTIRGFDQGGFILRDGFRTPNTFAARFFEMSNIERIEVLKGPASVKFGRIEPGGVINLVTKKPLREYRHSVEQRVGSYDFYQTTVDTTGPISGLESVQYRLIASYEDAESFRDVVENEIVFINPQIAWDITDRTRVNLSLEYRDDDRTNDSGLPALGGEVADVPEDTFLGSRDDFLKTEMLRVILDGSHAFNDHWRFRTKFLYEDFERRDARLDGAFGMTIDPTTGDFDRRFSANNVFPETYFTTNTLEGHFDTEPVQHTLLLGVDFTRSDIPWTFPDNAFAAGPGNNLFNPNPNLTVTPGPATQDFGSSGDFDERLGVFWQDQMSLFDDRLHILVGGRYDDTEAVSFGAENNNEEYSQRGIQPAVWPPVQAQAVAEFIWQLRRVGVGKRDFCPHAFRQSA